LEPEILTRVPIGPETGVNELIVGWAKSWVVTKLVTIKTDLFMRDEACS